MAHVKNRVVCGLLLAVLGGMQPPSSTASPFDPHVPPPKQPFVEGWYTRVTDEEQMVSFAVVMGSFTPPPPTGSQTSAPRQFTQTWVALLFNGGEGETVVAQGFASNYTVTAAGSPVTHDPANDTPANFQVYTTDPTLFLAVQNTTSTLSATIGNWTVQLNLSDRVAWDTSRPNSAAGPEGWVPDKLLPCHYFVHSLASAASYRISDGRTTRTGQGHAHQEANWGSTFPSAWVWGQGIGYNGTVQLLFTGGKFSIAGVTLPQAVIALRAPGIDLNFLSADIELITQKRDACAGTLELSAHDTLFDTHVEIVLKAAPKSFGRRLYVPGVHGFSNNPGCSESFSASAVITVQRLGKQTQTFTLAQVALEFGGDYLCPENDF